MAGSYGNLGKWQESSAKAVIAKCSFYLPSGPSYDLVCMGRCL